MWEVRIEMHLGSYFYSSDFQRTSRTTDDLHSIPCKNENFPFPQNVQTSSTALKITYTIATGCSCQRVKVDISEVDPHLHVLERLRMRGVIPSRPHTSLLYDAYLSLSLYFKNL